jgi:hypothetical protein
MLGSKPPNSGRKPASMKEAAFGRSPQRGRAAPRPVPFVGIRHVGWLSAWVWSFAPKHLILCNQMLGCKFLLGSPTDCDRIGPDFERIGQIKIGSTHISNRSERLRTDQSRLRMSLSRLRKEQTRPRTHNNGSVRADQSRWRTDRFR